MNELESIMAQLNEINNKRIKIQTLAEQAKDVCSEIEKKYNVNSPEELQKLVDIETEKYQNELEKAQQYISSAQEALKEWDGII